MWSSKNEEKQASEMCLNSCLIFLQITLGAILLLSPIDTSKIFVIITCKTVGEGGSISLINNTGLVPSYLKTLNNQPLVKRVSSKVNSKEKIKKGTLN